MKRKAVEKLCEPDIRNEFSISLVRITKSVNDHFCASSGNNIYPYSDWAFFVNLIIELKILDNINTTPIKNDYQ